MAPKAGKKQQAPPKSKVPPKKARVEEEELPEDMEDEEEEVDAEEGDELELGGEEEEEAGAPASDTPATRTRAKASGGDAAKRTKMAASSNALPQPTIADVLLGDHRDTVALLKKFEQVSQSGDKLMIEKLTDAIAIVIRLHSQAEFEVLYPLLEKRMGAKGKELYDKAMQEHSQIEEDLLKALEKRKEGDKELASNMKEIMDLFMEHLKEEEDDMVPELLTKMSDEEQVELAQSFLEAKARAPLTPQPLAS